MHTADHLLDLGRGLLGTVGQCSYLVGHHGKTAPLFTGARGLDGGVERQQVGLFGNRADDIQHLGDAVDLGSQRFNVVGGFGQVIGQGVDGRHRLAHLILAVARVFIGFARRVGGARGVAGNLFDRGGHFIDRSGGLLKLVVLLAQAAGGIFGNRIQLFRGGRQLRGGVADAFNGVAQAVAHGGQRLEQLGRFVAALDLHAL